VFFCTPGTVEEREQSRQGLQSAAGFIRKTLLKRLTLRIVPELEFVYDKSLDEGDKIERLLAQVRKTEGWDDPARARGSSAEVAAALKVHQRFLITSHTNPDGDAIASTLALGMILAKLGKQAVCYNPDPVPVNYRFLSGLGDLQTSFGEGSFDATVVLDCSELDRVGPLPAPERRGALIGIDHHLSAKPLGQAHYLDPAASSIGEMIDQVLTDLDVELDPPLATCLYTSILSDTGSFRYSNTTPAALRAAARMVAAGVSPWEVAMQVYESQPLTRLRLLTKALQTLEVDPLNRYGSILVSRQMFEEIGGGEDLIDGFINFPRSIEGVEVAIQFRELEPAKYKVSFRSRGRVNVASVAEGFGGGGHANAAGCVLSGTLPEIRQRIYQAVEAQLKD
jgi:phosphoesterase RecJ-like protein